MYDCILIASSLSKEDLHAWGAETGIELGPALQQADALTAKLRRLTLTTLHPKLATVIYPVMFSVSNLSYN